MFCEHSSYAKENGLIPQTFCGWVKREAKSGSVSKQDTCFVEIPARKKQGQEQQQEILVEKGDIIIHRALARIPLSVWIECECSVITSVHRTLGVIMEGLRAVP